MMIRIIALLLFPMVVFGQAVPTSGTYGELKFAYDKKTNNITGYFESYTGLDEQTGNPKFSCIFYLQGKVLNKKAKIITYYPADSAQDVIAGELQVIDNKEINVHLPEEHGGCWNVQHFVDEPVDFKLEKVEHWTEIRYVQKDKTYFYSDRSEASKRKAYLIKGNVVYVEKTEGEWVFCSYRPATYMDGKITQGWMKEADLNQLN